MNGTRSNFRLRSRSSRSRTRRSDSSPLEFIQLTIRDSRDLVYQAVEWAITEAGDAAFVRIHYDFQLDNGRGDGPRLRSNYVSLYRYRDAKIAQQEIYYDPSGRLEVLESDRKDRSD